MVPVPVLSLNVHKIIDCVFFLQTVEMVDKLGGVLGDLQELVELVYHFKDHYFEEHDLEEAAAKCDKAA